jgi:hypothetical protein
MANLGGWDGGIQISGRALADLAVALDQSVEPTVSASQATDVGGGVDVNCVELALNLELLVPRVLYATWNTRYEPEFGADPSSLDELEELHARLKEHAAFGPDDDDPNDPNDPGTRLTFIREQWFDGITNLPNIELNPADAVANTVRMRLRGRVHIGQRFVDGATALTSPLRFEMSLDYLPGVRRSNILLPDQLDVGMGSLPFTTLAGAWLVSPPPAGAEVWLPPGSGKPVWAGKLPNQVDDFVPDPCGDGTGSHWVLTTRAVTDHPDYQPELFTGAPGECIVDPTTHMGRWTVEDVVEMPNGLLRVPRRLLVDTASMNRPVAESGKQHAGLIFNQISELRIFDWPVLTHEQMAAIQRSIMKLDGFAVGTWIDPQLRMQAEALCRLLCPTCNCNIPEPDPPTLALLALLGRHGMDFAPLPGEVVAPIPNPSEQDGNAFIDSDVIVLHEDATRVFTPAAADSGAIAFGGVLGDRLDNAQRPPPDTPLPENFTNGQDLAIAVSENLIERQLNVVAGPELLRALRKNVPGFDIPSFRLDLDLRDNRFQLTISGSGETWLLVPVPFDFSVSFPIFLNVQPAIFRDDQGRPLGVDGEILPERRYVDDLDDSDGDIITPGFTPGLGCVGLYPPGDDFQATDPNLNPLSFLGYLDPRDPSFNTSPLLLGPWPLVNNETGCFPRDVGNPGGSWTFNPAIPSAYQWREAHFAVPPFRCPPQNPTACIPALRPGLAVSFKEPRKDQIDVDVDFSFLVDLFVPLLNVPLVATFVAERFVVEPIVRRKVYRQGIKQNFPEITPVSINQTTGWQIYLQHSDPLAQSNDAVSIDGGGLCLRFRIIPGPDPSLGSWAPGVCAGF